MGEKEEKRVKGPENWSNRQSQTLLLLKHIHTHTHTHTHTLASGKSCRDSSIFVSGQSAEFVVDALFAFLASTITKLVNIYLKWRISSALTFNKIPLTVDADFMITGHTEIQNNNF